MLKKLLKPILKTSTAIVLALTLLSGTCAFAEDTYVTYKRVMEKGISTAEGYDYRKPVPKNVAKGLDYFNDAVFLGDSRTVDLMIYSKVKETKAKAYCDIGLNVNTVFEKRFINYKNKKLTAIEALSVHKKKYSKVYIMFGINELGFDSVESFITSYKKLIDTVRTINPKAVVYVQSVLPVTKSKDHMSDKFNNLRAKKFNAYIKEMCIGRKVFYIDAYSAFQGADGYLPEAVASDGIHFGPEVSENWLSYLASRTLEYEPDPEEDKKEEKEKKTSSKADKKKQETSSKKKEEKKNESN